MNVEEGVEISQWRGDGRGAFVEDRRGEVALGMRSASSTFFSVSKTAMQISPF